LILLGTGRATAARCSRSARELPYESVRLDLGLRVLVSMVDIGRVVMLVHDASMSVRVSVLAYYQ